jgi:hypothetical protein
LPNWSRKGSRFGEKIMSDLPDRLRQWANYPQIHDAYDLIREAAERIEQLEDALQRLADSEIPAAQIASFARRELR